MYLKPKLYINIFLYIFTVKCKSSHGSSLRIDD